jgi:hypothetical protein
MNAGSTESAITLAIERWAKLHPFDLPLETWQQLFADHRPGDILQAIRKTSKSHSTDPAIVYRGLLHWITLFEREFIERQAPVWPPSGINRN